MVQPLTDNLQPFPAQLMADIDDSEYQARYDQALANLAGSPISDILNESNL
jgi:hypothetical protein